eukprot:3938102-Rhodomonas_salina.1
MCARQECGCVSFAFALPSSPLRWPVLSAHDPSSPLTPCKVAMPGADIASATTRRHIANRSADAKPASDSQVPPTGPDPGPK